MDKLSKRQIILIEKYISKEDFSLNSLEKCITARKQQIARHRYDISNIQQASDSKIGILTDFKRIKKATPKQQIVLEDYNSGVIQLETSLFCDAIEDKIRDIELDIFGLKQIRSVFVDKFEESLSNPSSPRSELESPRTSRGNLKEFIRQLSSNSLK